MISDWTIIVVALIAAATYLIPRMSTFIVNLQQLHRIERAQATENVVDFKPSEATSTGPYA